MAHPTITDVDRVAKFSVVSSQDTFNLPASFVIFNRHGSSGDADLQVFVDGVLKDSADWSFSGTFTNGAAAGGDVIFDTPITSGEVLIFGAMAARRTGDLTSGGLVTDDVNTEIDRLTAMVREVQYDLKRCIKIPLAEADSDETVVDQVAPALASRKNLGLAFDADGRPTAGTDTALEAVLIAINLLTMAADKGIYFSDSSTAALFDLTSVARTLVAQTTQALMRTTGLGLTSDGSDLVTAANYAAMRTLLGLVIGTDVQAFDADTLFADTADVLSAGFSVTPFSAGTKSTGTYTPDPADGNIQYAVNGGAHTLAPPASACSMIIEYLNNASAGTITTSGFTKVDGTPTTTDTQKFLAQILVTENYSYLNWVALQ